MPDLSKAFPMSPSRPGSANCRGDRFTAMRNAGMPWRCQATFCAQAVSMTHLPIGTISPVSSASGMKWLGCNRPRSGCCQRSRASTSETPP
jgi:hypothetical protein